MWDGSELVLRCAERVGGGVRRRQVKPDRIECGKPAHRAGDIHIGDAVFPAMSFGVEAESAASRHPAERQRQRGQEHFIDAGPGANGQGLEQSGGFVLRELGVHQFDAGLGVGPRGGDIGRKAGGEVGREIPPESQFAGGFGGGGEQVRTHSPEGAAPSLEGIGGGSERPAGKGRFKVVDDNAPRDAVDHVVMRAEEKLVGC